MHKLQDTEIFLASRARIVNLDRILLHCFQGHLRLDEVRSSLQYLAHDSEIQAVVFNRRIVVERPAYWTPFALFAEHLDYDASDLNNLLFPVDGTDSGPVAQDPPQGFANGCRCEDLQVPKQASHKQTVQVHMLCLLLQVRLLCD